jgi:hypothetical protein
VLDWQHTLAAQLQQLDLPEKLEDLGREGHQQDRG